MRGSSLKWVEIDLKSLAHNIRWVRGRLAPGVRFMAVVKADAYGHGAARVGKLALSHGADRLGVLTLEEAQALGGAGIRKRTVILCPPLPEEAAAAARSGAEITVDSMVLARALDRAASRRGRGRVPVHVDLDYGLGRWGLAPKDLPAFLKSLRGLKSLTPVGISAHLDYVPGRNAVEAEDKLRDFRRRAARARELYPGLLRHCANSGALLDFPHWQLDMVRIGNLIYGIDPTKKDRPLKNPWTLKARVTSIREFPKGASIGYGSEYLAPRRLKIAALPIGYADGLTMENAERLIGFGKAFHYWGWLRGHKVPFVTRCGIAHVLIDVSGVPNPKVGDVVTLPVRRTAASPRLPRVYK